MFLVTIVENQLQSNPRQSQSQSHKMLNCNIAGLAVILMLFVVTVEVILLFEVLIVGFVTAGFANEAGIVVFA